MTHNTSEQRDEQQEGDLELWGAWHERFQAVTMETVFIFQLWQDVDTALRQNKQQKADLQSDQLNWFGETRQSLSVSPIHTPACACVF